VGIPRVIYRVGCVPLIPRVDALHTEPTDSETRFVTPVTHMTHQ